MILGNALTIGGSDSGLTSTIIVTAPTGSTVTLTDPNGTTTTGTEISGTWTFGNLSLLGTYTVTATKDSNSKTQTVLANTVGLYNVTISYALYLYNEGNECTSVTGGWINGGAINGTNSLTKNTNNITLYCSNMNACTGVITNNKIDFTGYTKLYALFDVTNTLNGSVTQETSWSYWGISPTYQTWSRTSIPSDIVYYKEGSIADTGSNITSLVELNNEIAYAFLEVSWGYQRTVTLVIHKIWLE